MFRDGACNEWRLGCQCSFQTYVCAVEREEKATVKRAMECTFVLVVMGTDAKRREDEEASYVEMRRNLPKDVKQ